MTQRPHGFLCDGRRRSVSVSVFVVYSCPPEIGGLISSCTALSPRLSPRFPPARAHTLERTRLGHDSATTLRWAADCRPQRWPPAAVRGDACRRVPLPGVSGLPGSMSPASFLSRHTPGRGRPGGGSPPRPGFAGSKEPGTVQRLQLDGVPLHFSPMRWPQLGGAMPIGPLGASTSPMRGRSTQRNPAIPQKLIFLHLHERNRGTEGGGVFANQIANSALPIPPRAKSQEPPQSRPSPSHPLAQDGQEGQECQKCQEGMRESGVSNRGKAVNKLRRRHD